jgi:hypothetical protein
VGRDGRRDSALIDAGRAWGYVLRATFIVCCAGLILGELVAPIGFGFHAVVYTDAARAWLAGGNPWTVGPPAVVFAGPPPMLVPYLPFVPFGIDVVRFSWIAIDVVLAVWAIGRLGLPRYWLFFPPLFNAIALGHPEVVILGLFAAGGAVSGLAAAIKPYALLPLIAERRWRAIAVAIGAVVASLPFLPWSLFISQAGAISSTIARQNVGDSTFGQPLLMIVAAGALLVLGPRRALWLAVPVLWPDAQPIYKVMTMPVLSPVVALAWAIPIPGFTLVGVIVEAVLVVIDRRHGLSPWLKVGITPVVAAFDVAGGLATFRRRPEMVAV